VKKSFENIICSLGIKGRVETKEIEDNRIYTKLFKRVESYVQSKEHLMELLKVKRYQLYSVVEKFDVTVIKEHNTIDFILVNGSVLRVSSLDSDSIELTRILVPKTDRMKGIGSNLVVLVLSIIENVLGYVPRMELECTGGIGVGETYEEMDVSSQVSFFQRFNFKVCDSLPSSRRYVRMWRPPSPRIPPYSGDINSKSWD
jgi:hypothetical protein